MTSVHLCVCVSLSWALHDSGLMMRTETLLTHAKKPRKATNRARGQRSAGIPELLLIHKTRRSKCWHFNSSLFFQTCYKGFFRLIFVSSCITGLTQSELFVLLWAKHCGTKHMWRTSWKQSNKLGISKKLKRWSHTLESTRDDFICLQCVSVTLLTNSRNILELL